MISLKNFDSLVMVYTLVRCSWAASFMPMILCCFLVTVMVYKNGIHMQRLCNRFGIRFNSSKSQTTVFGGRSPSHFVVKLNGAPVPYVDTVKYFGVFINSRTNCFDPSAALRNFFGYLIILCQFLRMAEMNC